MKYVIKRQIVYTSLFRKQESSSNLDLSSNITVCSNKLVSMRLDLNIYNIYIYTYIKNIYMNLRLNCVCL